MMHSFDNSLKTFSDGLHRIRSAKARHHNTLLPISRLPNDLLVEIFTLASAMEDRLTRQCCGDRTNIRMLATLAFVCHEWREIVHTTPSLWTYISADHPETASLECLARSDQAPLRISVEYPLFQFPARHKFKTRIIHEVHRWKSADISDMDIELLRELEQRPAPLLEMLDIRGNMGSAAVMRNLFCGSASRLRHLSLTHFRIPWDSSLLSHLRTLSIGYWRDDGPSVQQVVHILQSCPDLTIFDLCLRPELHPGPIPPGVSTVDLPQLEHLSISVHPLMAEHLLQRMRIPSCKTFHVNDTDATGPTFSLAMDHLIPSLTSILPRTGSLNLPP
ncbi:hypothetical protein FRB95_004952 [Tulasnella sp. JGI-2019a]|nr:hypothetical protein FRB95_004952 [Tulasnella sp. JGI-2019a]